MAAIAAETETRVVELSAEALELFCQDISAMFETDMNCKQQDVCDETINGLKKRFKNMAAVTSAKMEEELKGTFLLVLDREGLFTLAGILVMHPSQKIIENRKRGTIKDAEYIRDTVQEVGNLLVGSWNRVFNTKWNDRIHLQQTGTFIGLPWDNPNESIGLAVDEKLLFISYEVTVGDYPAFKLGVIFPKKLFDLSAAPDIKQDNPTVKEEEPEAKTAPEATEEKTAEVPDNKTESAEATPIIAEDKSAVEAVDKEILSPANPAKEAALSKPNQTITANMGFLGTLCARDVMVKNIVWGTGEDSVEQLFIKMEQNGVSHVIIGDGKVPEGIVSMSDLMGAMSPYLRPAFAKFRRPLDEASLQIKVKWIMGKPVYAVRSEKPLATVMENMCRFGVRALPVIDQQGKVEGIITVFDIFGMLLQIFATDKTAVMEQDAKQ